MAKQEPTDIGEIQKIIDILELDAEELGCRLSTIGREKRIIEKKLTQAKEALLKAYKAAKN